MPGGQTFIVRYFHAISGSPGYHSKLDGAHLVQMQPYERFRAWRACHELHLMIAEETDHWPRSERFELAAQARRSAWSVVANLVEGSAKRGAREFRRFLDISVGSLAELHYVLRFALDRGYMSAQTHRALLDKHTEAAKLTWGLYRRVSAAAGLAVRGD